MKILWLASWYPDAYEPYNGDFVQRHAYAVASLVNIDVIHIVQKDIDITVLAHKQVKTIPPSSTETICYFNYSPTGIKWLDKIRFNSTYLQYGKQILQDYITTNGLPDIIHVHAPMKMGMLALYAKQKWGIPYIVSEQASHYELSAPDNFFARSSFYKTQTKRIFQHAVGVTNVSTTIATELKNIFNIKAIATVHNCVNTNFFFYKPSVDNTVFTFIHVSSLNEQKNIDGMLAGFKQLHDINKHWQLLLVGPSNNEVKQQVYNLQLQENVHVKGVANYKQVATYMQQAHAFVLFSNHENFPCVVVEALCCGLPVIASTVGGVAEAINPSNGLLVEPNNLQQLTNALSNIIVKYGIYNRQNIAANAQALYSYNAIGNQFIDYYTTINSQITINNCK